MGVSGASGIQDQLLTALPADTPVAIVQHASLPSQRHAVATLATLAATIASEACPARRSSWWATWLRGIRVWFVTLSPEPLSQSGLKQVAVDARTGQALAEPQLDSGFMYIMFSLHVDLFAGLAGKLFLGFMGLLLLVAIVSGVVLYAPFMRKLRFGEVRHERSGRTKWLDLHNLLGIVTLTWLFVVGATGMINTWADLLVRYWQMDQMAEMVAPYKGQPPVTQVGSLQQAVVAARALEPGMKMGFIAFPGTAFTSPHHYGVFMRGTEPLTARLFKPVLVDAQTSQVTNSRELPWYLQGLLLSQPLHFGDYGGLPMQILWTVLDIITIIVLGSGLYLWWVRRVPAGKREAAAGGDAGEMPVAASEAAK
jgi:uncharacterized iron-regulated membrane protein